MMDAMSKKKSLPEGGAARETVDTMVEAGLLDDLMARVGDDGLRLWRGRVSA